jgi:cell division protein ZapA
MTQENNVIRVTIYGTEYPVRGESDVEYIRQVAEYVDRKMNEVDRNTSAKSTLKVAILAALNIADELFREKAEKESLVQRFEEEISKLTNLLKIEDSSELSNSSNSI